MPGFWSRLIGGRQAIQPVSNDAFSLKTLRHGKHALSLTRRPDTAPAYVSWLCNPPQQQRLLLCIPDADRWIGWLMAPDGAPLAIEGAPSTGPAVPVRLRRPAGQDSVILAHPLDREMWLAPRGDALQPERKTAFNAAIPPAHAVLQLDPAPTASVAREISATASLLSKFIEPPYGFATVLTAMRSLTGRPDLVEPLLALLPAEELAALAAHLLTQPKDLHALRKAMPKDRWLGERITSLIAWRANRDGAAPRERRLAAESVNDLSGRKDALVAHPTLGMSLVTLGRRATPPRRLACVLGSARNEGPYLLEWIAHHRAIGFDHIFLYSNNNTDGSDELLRLLAQAGRITWIDQEMGPNALPQFRAYAHALSVLPDMLDYRWTLLVDLDEFFCLDIKKFKSARDFLLWQDHAGAEAVAMPWLIFAARPEDKWHDTPCIERFQLREETVNHHIKSAFRTNLFCGSNCHHPSATMRQNFAFLAETGLPHVALPPANSPSLSKNPQAINAFIAHYIFRSAPEALAKVARGRGDDVRGAEQDSFADMARRFVTLHQEARLVADNRPRACATGLAKELWELRAIPGAAACESKIKRRFALQLTTLREQILRAGASPGEIEACAVFREYLQNSPRRQAA